MRWRSETLRQRPTNGRSIVRESLDVVPPVQKPRHSFEYLHHLVKKCKLELEKEKDAREGGNSRMDVDTEESTNGLVVSQPKASIHEAWQKVVAQPL